MGRLIPAGTGLPMYRNIEVEVSLSEILVPTPTIEETAEI
jgi:hypothetical protein